MAEIEFGDVKIQIKRNLYIVAKSMWGDDLQVQCERIMNKACEKQSRHITHYSTIDMRQWLSEGIYYEAEKRKLPGWRNLAF